MDNIQRRYLRLGMLLLAGLSSLGMWQFRLESLEQGWFELSTKLRLVEKIGWGGLGLLWLLVVYIWIYQTARFHKWLTIPISGKKWTRSWAIPLILMLLCVYPFLMFGKMNYYFIIDWTRQAIFAWLVVVMSSALAVWREKSLVKMLPFAAAMLGVAYHLATYIPDISNYPFALGWSETTRYYVASTFFDQRIYGIDLPMVFRDFTRYLMQAIPFLVEDSPLWVHRLWQAVLRFSSTYFAGYMLAKRYRIKGKEWVALFTMWAGLFFFQGPVFYNLMVIVLLVLWLLKDNRFWRTLTLVAAVSVWAGLSRINWIPMPGLIAAVFYILEEPIPGKDFKGAVRYLWKPAAWVVMGTLVGLGVQQGYAMISGNPEEIYYASFTSYLLWDRLLPNPSYRLGILPHILLLTTPILGYLGMTLAGWRRRWQWIRPLGLVGIIGGMFVGGLVVSVKIGGGTNLHNMDVFLVILILAVAEIFFGRAVDDEGKKLEMIMPSWIKVLVFAAPILFVVSFSGGTIPERDMQAAELDLNILQEVVDKETADGGEALFISQRHLISFGLIEDVPLVHSHEKLLLQEMVMSRNETYLEEFRLELINQRYSVIIHDPLPRVYKFAEAVPLAVENNVVFNELSPWFACYYRELARIQNGSLVIFVPAEVVTCDLDEE